MAQPRDSRGKPKADLSLLTKEEIEALKAEAAKTVQADAKKAARTAALEEFTAAERRKSKLDEADDTVTVDLAPYSDRVLLDNRAFLQGETYTLPVSVANVLREVSARTWRHQAEIDGKSENYYRRVRAQHITPNGVVNTSQLLRV